MNSIVKSLRALTTKLGGTDTTSKTVVDALKKVYGAYGGTGSTAKTISGAIDEITTVASSGGGGSSDFSVATVTIVNTGDPESVYIANAYDEEGFSSSMYDVYLEEETTEFQAVLYKGSAYLSIQHGEILSVTGDATWEEGASYVIVQGNCEISVQLEQVEPNPELYKIGTLTLTVSEVATNHKLLIYGMCSQFAGSVVPYYEKDNTGTITLDILGSGQNGYFALFNMSGGVATNILYSSVTASGAVSADTKLGFKVNGDCSITVAVTA